MRDYSSYLVYSRPCYRNVFVNNYQLSLTLSLANTILTVSNNHHHTSVIHHKVIVNIADSTVCTVWVNTYYRICALSMHWLQFVIWVVCLKQCSLNNGLTLHEVGKHFIAEKTFGSLHWVITAKINDIIMQNIDVTVSLFRNVSELY